MALELLGCSRLVGDNNRCCHWFIFDATDYSVKERKRWGRSCCTREKRKRLFPRARSGPIFILVKDANMTVCEAYLLIKQSAEAKGGFPLP